MGKEIHREESDVESEDEGRSHRLYTDIDRSHTWPSCNWFSKWRLTSPPRQLFSITIVDFHLTSPPRQLFSMYDAAESGDLEQVKRLVNEGRDVNNKNWCGETALHAAITNNHTEVAQYLISLPQCDVRAQDEWGETALHYACEKNNLAVVRALLKRDPKLLNMHDMNANSALDIAERRGNVDIAQTVYHAAKCGNLEQVKRLVNEGRDVNERNFWRPPPLHAAIRKNHTKVARYLISLPQCDVRAQDAYERTALHYACEENNLAVVRALVERGPELLDVCDEFGDSALDVAKRMRNLDIVKYMRAKIGMRLLLKIGFTLESVERRGYFDMVEGVRYLGRGFGSGFGSDFVLDKKANNRFIQTPLSSSRNLFKYKNGNDWEEKWNIKPRQQNQKDLSDRHLLDIAMKLGPKWKTFIVALGMEQEWTKGLSNNAKSLENEWACLKALVKWRDNHGGSLQDKKQELKQALNSAGRKDVCPVV